MTGDDRRVLRDRELVELLSDEAELLAIADAYAATQQDHWRTHRRGRLWQLGALAAVVAAVAAPTAAFADQIGSILGLASRGTPVATDQLPPKQLSALEQINFPIGHVRLLADRAGVSFYVAGATDGSYCFAIGLRPHDVPDIDALACQGGTIGSFPSASDQMADFSAVDASPDGSYVTTLAGFAADDVSRVSILGPEDDVIYSAPVEQNVYAATDLPQNPAMAIVAYDSSGGIVYRRQLGAPTPPQPMTPPTPGSSGT